MSLSGCPTTGFVPPQDRGYQNLRVNDTLVARKVVFCDTTSNTLEVNNLIVNNQILTPDSTSGSYTPTVVFQTGISVGPNALQATFNTIGKVTFVSGQTSLTPGLAPCYFTISLPTANSFSTPIGTANWVQDPPVFNTGAGAVAALNGSPSNVAEITFAGPGGIPGVVVFVFSYQSSL